MSSEEGCFLSDEEINERLAKIINQEHTFVFKAEIKKGDDEKYLLAYTIEGISMLA